MTNPRSLVLTKTPKSSKTDFAVAHISGGLTMGWRLRNGRLASRSRTIHPMPTAAYWPRWLPGNTLLVKIVPAGTWPPFSRSDSSVSEVGIMSDPQPSEYLISRTAPGSRLKQWRSMSAEVKRWQEEWKAVADRRYNHPRGSRGIHRR